MILRTAAVSGSCVALLLAGCDSSTVEPTAVQELSPTPSSEILTDVTQASHLAFVHIVDPLGEYRLPEEMGAGGALLDFDGDGDLDIYLVQSGSVAEPDQTVNDSLFRNEGADLFLDYATVDRDALRPRAGYGMGASAADYDRDGDLDVYITCVGPNALLRNNGDGTFSEVAATAGVDDPAFGASATFLDYDRDGLLDLYVVNYVDWAANREGSCFDARGLRDYCSPVVYDTPAADRLYRGTAAGSFVDVTLASGVGTSRGNGLGVLATDFDGDGWVDIFVANDQTPGFLWMNRRDGTFIEDAAFRGCAFDRDGMAIAGMGVVAEDLDHDQDLDLVVTNIRGQPHLGLRNDITHFVDISHSLGLIGWGVPRTGFGIGLADLDLDGTFEGVVVNGAVNRLGEPYAEGLDYAEPDQLLRRDAAGRFIDITDEAAPALRQPGMSRSLMLGDLDHDGDPDLVITNNRGPARFLRTDPPTPSAWLVVDLVGPGGRRDTFNSEVLVHTAERTQLREVRSAQGYLSSSDSRLFFGLGKAKQVDRLEITWSDGSRQVLENLPVDRFLTLQQTDRHP